MQQPNHWDSVPARTAEICFCSRARWRAPNQSFRVFFLEFERIGLHVNQMNSDANARRRLPSALDWPPDCWIICKTGSAQAAFVIICRAQVWNLLPVQSKRRDAEVMPSLSRVTVPALRLCRRGCQFTLTGFSLTSRLIAFWLRRLVFFSLSLTHPSFFHRLRLPLPVCHSTCMLPTGVQAHDRTVTTWHSKVASDKGKIDTISGEYVRSKKQHVCTNKNLLI